MAAGRREVSIPLEQPSTDDYLLALARAAGANLFAESTRFKETEPPLRGEWQEASSRAAKGQWSGAMGNLLLELATERGLTQQQMPGKMFLCWSEPDVVGLARSLAAAGLRRRLTVENVERFESTEDALGASLAAFFVEGGWDGRAPLSKAAVPFSSLPPELQAQIRAHVREQQSGSPRNLDLRVWLSDEFWRGAVVTLPEEIGPNAARMNDEALARHLLVSGVVDRSARSIAWASRFLAAPRDGDVRLRTLDVEPAPPAASDPSEPQAQVLAPPVLAVAKAPPEASLDLAVEAPLQTPVSFEGKRITLAALLGDLKKQAGVELGMAPRAQGGARLVTVRFQDLPLRNVMSALSALLGVRWRKGAGGYAAHPASEAEAGLLALGDVDWYRYWHEPVRWQVAPRHLSLQPLSTLPVDVLLEVGPLLRVPPPRAPGGRRKVSQRRAAPAAVPLSELSPPVQGAVRAEVERAAALQFVEQARRSLREPASSGLASVRVAPAASEVSIVSAEGRPAPASASSRATILDASGQPLVSFLLRPVQ